MLFARPQGYAHHPVVVLHCGERVADGLVQATAHQDITYLLLGLKGKIAALQRQYVIHQRHADHFIADDARDLLSQVRGHLDIQPVPGSDTTQERLTLIDMQPERAIPQFCTRSGKNF